MKKLIIARIVLPVLCVILLPSLSPAQDTDSLFIRRIANEMLLNGKAYENLRQLTKQVGGRLAGSPQMVKAENWGLSTLKQSGADTAYFQQCMVPHWIRGGVDQASVISIDDKKQKRNLEVLALGNSMGSGKNGVTAEVIAVSSFDDLEKHKDEVKGKIVFYNYKFKNPDSEKLLVIMSPNYTKLYLEIHEKLSKYYLGSLSFNTAYYTKMYLEKEIIRSKEDLRYLAVACYYTERVKQFEFSFEEREQIIRDLAAPYQLDNTLLFELAGV